MNRRPLPRLAAQLIVLLPTLAVTGLLGQLRMAPVPRMLAGIGVGLVLITLVTWWQRRAGSR
jgi:hypothetical protein